MVFTASWSSQVTLITCSVVPLLFLSPLLVFSLKKRLGVTLFVTLICWGIIAATVPAYIKGYQIESGQVEVLGLFGSESFPIADITDAYLDPQGMDNSVRTFANGGIFSFYGQFSNERLGQYFAYVTDPARSVVLRFPDKIVVISPDRPQEFLKSLYL